MPAPQGTSRAPSFEPIRNRATGGSKPYATSPSPPDPRLMNARKRRLQPPKPRRFSPTRPPEDLSIGDWQPALRRQFGREQHFELENLGSEPVFSEFGVRNPKSGRSYRVAIRGTAPGDNYCSCPDFATNELGTCKHIEFTLGRLERRRSGQGGTGARLRARLQRDLARYGADATSASAPEASARPRSRNAPAPCSMPATAGGCPAGRFDGWKPLLEAARRSATSCASMTMSGVRGPAARGCARQRRWPRPSRKARRPRPCASCSPCRCTPTSAKARCSPPAPGRACIGDDMGLGKTIQAIAAAELLPRHFGVAARAGRLPDLAQASVAERDRTLHRPPGAGHRRPAAAAREPVRPPRHLQDHQLRHGGRDLDLIDAWAPDLVIADEAQRIKNWNTIAAARAQADASPYAIVLTGTPLENRLEELISIVQFVDQHRLGPPGGCSTNTSSATKRPRHRLHAAGRASAKTLAPVMLRRRKAEVLAQLPERLDKRFFVPLTPQQRVHHDENGEIVARIVARWRKTTSCPTRDQRRLHCALQIMRMSATAPICWTRKPTTAQGGRTDDAAGRAARRPGHQGGGLQPVAGHARADPSRALWRAPAGAMCCSTAACPASSAARWSSASTTTPPAACFCPPTPAAWA